MRWVFTAFLTAALLPGVAGAKVGAEAAARLGKDLTPLGAEQAGNAAGTIPAWTGGISAPPAGYQPGQHHLDPYAGDQPLYTVSAANIGQYAEQLSEGQKALLQTYPDWKLKVYPTRRSAAFPKRIYAATQANATRAELADNGLGVKDAFVGIPFPIPASGLEAVWNHELRYRGDHLLRQRGQAAVHEDGSYNLVKFNDKFDGVYSRADEGAKRDYTLFRIKQEITAPAGPAGTIVLVHETTNVIEAPRRTWIFSPKDKRVRRVGEYAYDDPSTAADSLVTVDQFDMYSGTPDRYDWKLVGKKELLVPYNAYKLHSDSLKYSDILLPGHINPEHARYELHRVWVVEGRLKLGTSHAYSKRVLYIDEDSWQTLVADHYDEAGKIWRVAEAHGLNYYEVPVQWDTLEVFHDLKDKRYLVSGLDNEESMYDFKTAIPDSEFTSGSVRRQGK